MSDSQKECPSCAMEIEKASAVCPVCGYEFPSRTRTNYGTIAAILFILIFLFTFLIGALF